MYSYKFSRKIGANQREITAEIDLLEFELWHCFGTSQLCQIYCHNGCHKYETPRPSPPAFFSILLSGLDFWIDFCVSRSAFPRLVEFLSCNPMWLKILTSVF